MGKKITRKEFEERVRIASDDTIDVSEFDFQKTQSRGTCICKVCGHKWKTEAYSILQGHRCRNCYNKRNSKRRIIELSEIQKRINSNGKHCTIIGEYIDTKHRCCVKCDKCGNIWRPITMDLLRGHGCSVCSAKENGENERLTNDEYVERCKEIYGDEYDLSEIGYTTMRGSVFPICPKHGKVEIGAYQFLKGNGCKKCRMSGGQRDLGKFLKDNGILICEEYNDFEWLTRKKSGRMSFDFYLPQLKIAIEYQGRQHFEKVEIFGGEEGLILTKERDEYKKKVCKENDIQLVYFLPHKYEKYMEQNDMYFTDKDKLLNFLKNYEVDKRSSICRYILE